MASQEIVTMECFQWINRLMLNTRYLHNIYSEHRVGGNESEGEWHWTDLCLY